MEMLLKRANFSWFRLMLAQEPDETKRAELERKLDEAEARFEASLEDEHAHA
jgi:hypothetical protein